MNKRKIKSNNEKVNATVTFGASTFDLLETLLQAVIEKYPDDRASKPGVVLSHVDGKFYGSVCRYPGGGRDKVVAFSHYADTAKEVVDALALFVAGPSDAMRQKLREYL